MILNMFDVILQSKLESIAEHLTAIGKYFTSIKKFEDFHDKPDGQKTFDAIMMRLQATEETLKQINTKYPDILEKHSEVKWEKIIRLRDAISHHHQMLETEIVFDICSQFVPRLKTTITKMLRE